MKITEESFRNGGFRTYLQNTMEGRFIRYGSLCAPTPSESVWLVPGTEETFAKCEAPRA